MRNLAKAYLNNNGVAPSDLNLCSDFSDFYDAGGADLIGMLADNATSAYETSVVANANPLNAALITGGQASTPYGTTQSLLPASISGGSVWILLAAAVAVIFLATRK